MAKFKLFFKHATNVQTFQYTNNLWKFILKTIQYNLKFSTNVTSKVLNFNKNLANMHHITYVSVYHLLNTKICNLSTNTHLVFGIGLDDPYSWTCMPKKQTSTPSISSKANIALARYGKESGISSPNLKDITQWY